MVVAALTVSSAEMRGMSCLSCMSSTSLGNVEGWTDLWKPQESTML